MWLPQVHSEGGASTIRKVHYVTLKLNNILKEPPKSIR